MSAKKMNKKIPVLIIAGILLVAAVLWFSVNRIGTAVELPEDAQTAAPAASAETEPAAQLILREALLVREIGSHTGPYWEDGSDEQVTDVLSMTVTNVTEDPIQYAQITMELPEGTATFSVTALPAGETAVLLETGRMRYDKSIDYGSATVECQNLAGFDKPLSLQEQKLEIQLLDGALNITNISGEDIAGTIILCYKNVENGIYQGGIGYRIRLEEGLKAGEIRQIMATHIHQPGTELVFVQIGQ